MHIFINLIVCSLCFSHETRSEPRLQTVCRTCSVWNQNQNQAVYRTVISMWHLSSAKVISPEAVYWVLPCQQSIQSGECIFNLVSPVCFHVSSLLSWIRALFLCDVMGQTARLWPSAVAAPWTWACMEPVGLFRQLTITSGSSFLHIMRHERKSVWTLCGLRCPWTPHSDNVLNVLIFVSDYWRICFCWCGDMNRPVTPGAVGGSAHITDCSAVFTRMY